MELITCFPKAKYLPYILKLTQYLRTTSILKKQKEKNQKEK